MLFLVMVTVTTSWPGKKVILDSSILSHLLIWGSLGVSMLNMGSTLQSLQHVLHLPRISLSRGMCLIQLQEEQSRGHPFKVLLDHL